MEVDLRRRSSTGMMSVMDWVERPSDADRERVASLLRDRCAEGYLSPETLSDRIECAYSTRRRSQLEALVRDLPRSVGDRLRTTWREAVTAVRFRGELSAPGTPVLRLAPPRGPTAPSLVFGRAIDCDYRLFDPTVSRRHAELRFDGASWRVSDLGSSNGTYVNGLRILRARVEPGDTIAFGETACVLEAVAP